jgi:hypothetical protein
MSIRHLAEAKEPVFEVGVLTSVGLEKAVQQNLEAEPTHLNAVGVGEPLNGALILTVDPDALP